MKQLLVRLFIVGAIALGYQSSLRAAEVLRESDFGKCPVKVEHAMAGSFKGVLPEGWGDSFIGWNKSQVESRVVAEHGRQFLRFTVTKIDPAGNPQFVAGVPKLTDGGFYRLTLRVRNDATGPLSIGIRMEGAPYRYRYERQIGISPEWVEKSWCFKLDKSVNSLAIFLVPCGVGQVDIATIRVEKLTTPAELAAMVSRPAPTARNFFRNSRLPLGLQAGWNLSRMSDKGTAKVDPNCIGPSGSPALRLDSNGQIDSFSGDKGLILYCEPFQVADPTVKHRAALSFRGKGTWQVAVGPGAAKTIEATDDWKRVSVEFMPNVEQKYYAMEISGNGTLWVDAFSAWAGDKDRAYESAGECEVALGLGPSEIAETRIQFDNEPAAVAYRVTGNGKGTVLKSKVTNINGREKSLPDVRLTAANLAGTIGFGVLPETPYGQFRIEAWAERDGRRISPMNEMVVTRVRRPICWGKDAPDSPFGCHFLSVDRTIDMMKAGGVNWARLHDAGMEYIGWYWLEPEKGKWQFHDEEIQRYRKHHIKVFGQLGTAPKWASYLSRVKNGPEKPSFSDFYISHYFQPLNLNDFANYVKTVIAHYKGVIDEYFVWNEPFYVGWWPVAYDKAKGEYITSKHPQADFAAMMKAAYTAAKSVDPTVKVAGINTCTWELGRDWTKGVYDAGGLAWCDMIDYHFYTNSPQGFCGSHTDGTYNDAVGYIRQKEGRLDKPVYMTEGSGRPGTPDGQGTTEPAVNAGLYKHALPFDPGEDSILKADLLCKYVLNLLANQVEKVFLYSAHCYWNLGAAASSDFGALLGGDGYPHPSLAAHSNLAWHLESRKFVKAVNLADGVYAYLFMGRDRTVAVISGRPGSAVYRIPAAKGLAVSDLFGNPLTADAAYKGTLVYVETAGAPEAVEKILSGK